MLLKNLIIYLKSTMTNLSFIFVTLRYFSWLLPLIVDLQHSRGGPIIQVQVENEFGSFCTDPSHMIYMRDLLLQHGIMEMLVSCDNESAAGKGPIIDGVFPTANGQTVEEIRPNFEIIKKLSSDFPLMVMEFWTGWFDHWGRVHETRAPDVMRTALEYCMKENASVNFYMFHGGTNFGFMAGALDLSKYKPDTTSYDYDAPVSEEGRLTQKALLMREMIQQEVADKCLNIDIPDSLPENPKRAEQSIELVVEEAMSWSDQMVLVNKNSKSGDLNYMEMFVYEDGEVQSGGYIVYRKEVKISRETSLSLPSPVRDRVMVLVNGRVQGVLTRDGEDPSPCVTLSPPHGQRQEDLAILDIVVENLGRVNYTVREKQELLSNQRKGLCGTVRLGEEDIHGWEVKALDFNTNYMETLSKKGVWTKFHAESSCRTIMPGLFRASLDLTENPIADYFVRLSQWGKGVVFVNGFNLGRYWEIGPTQTLYLPAPLLKKGLNHIIIFEEIKMNKSFTLDVEPSLGPTKHLAKM